MVGISDNHFLDGASICPTMTCLLQQCVVLDQKVQIFRPNTIVFCELNAEDFGPVLVQLAGFELPSQTPRDVDKCVDGADIGIDFFGLLDQTLSQSIFVFSWQKSARGPYVEQTGWMEGFLPNLMFSGQLDCINSLLCTDPIPVQLCDCL